MKKGWLVVAFLLLGISSAEAGSEKYGPESKRLGAGIVLGEPMAADVKGYIWRNLAVTASGGWSLLEEGFTVGFDATYDLFDISVGSGQSTLPFYAGLGFKLTFDQGGADDGSTHAAMRLPLGLALQLSNTPVEFFMQAAPGIEFNPDTEFDMTGGVGVRYYFF